MSISESDNRIRLTDLLVDFNDLVGVTGQDHDTFPSPGQEPRYDWMRSFLIGMLSLQSSLEAPTEKRTGTLWYDKAKQISLFDGEEWVSLAAAIESKGVSLAEFYALVDSKVRSIKPAMTFSGVAQGDKVFLIPIPRIVQESISDTTSYMVLMWINGFLADPSLVMFTAGCPTIELDIGIAMDDGDRFTVVLKPLDQVGGDLELLET